MNPQDFESLVKEYKLMDQAVHLSFKKGQVLFYKGHRPHGVFLLLGGHVQLSAQFFQECQLGREKIKVVALDNLVNEEPYQENCIAQDNVSVCFLSKQTLISCFHPIDEGVTQAKQ